MENKDSTVKLVGFWVSPFVQRVRWALKLKGIEYEYIEEDIFNRSHLLSELNPVHQKVPVLVHNGKPLPESFIILEYIDETWKHNPSLPQDPHERATARFWAKFAEEKLFGAAWIGLCSEDDEQEGAVKSSIEALEKIEEKLKGKNFFGGDRIGYVDIINGWISYMLPIWEEVASMKIYDPMKFPAVTSWISNFREHPVIKEEYLPSKDEMIVYFQWRRKVLKGTYPPMFSNLVKKI
ncbi:Glutathione S-transferase U7 [Forsythia ovata]|uniref:Probable glutathione S-transferase n=1 Tax=Forsythia ovata TaxID=205694 RepID=A0ABD1V0H9_9LAMI